MSDGKKKRDKHFPNIAFLNPFRKWFIPPESIFGPYLSRGGVAADLGCGPGYFIFPMAERVGMEGMVYAIDSNGRCIRAIERRKKKLGVTNIETHASSAHALDFIGDATVDFVLAWGLLCSMAPENHIAAVHEIKRILRPEGYACLSVARGSMSYVDDDEWEGILREFNVKERSSSQGCHSASVSLKR